MHNENQGPVSDRFFQGFKWAVPTAFASSVNQCRFERGDTFYDSCQGYQIWEEATKHITHSIQVTFPAHATAKATSDANAFEANWVSPVEFTITNHKTSESRQVKSTQGKLYTLLWIGDWNVLTAPAEPQIPSTCHARTFTKQAENVAKQVKSRCCTRIAQPNLFVMPYDPTHPIASAKYEDLKQGLAEKFPVVEAMFKPGEVGVTDFCVPTLRFAAFIVDTKDSQSLADTLKRVLYLPTRDRKSKQDKFSIAAHGGFLSFAPVLFNAEFVAPLREGNLVATNNTPTPLLTDK